MSNVNSLLCKNCGGSLQINEGESVAVCDFCKSTYYVSGFQLRRYYLKPEIDYNQAYGTFNEIIKSKNLHENIYSEFRLIFVPIYRFTGFSVGLSPQKKVVGVKEKKSLIPSLMVEDDIYDSNSDIFLKEVKKEVKKVKVETRVNDDLFEYYFDGSFFLEKGFFSQDLFNKIKGNIKRNKFYGFDREKMESYGRIFIPSDEVKFKENMREESISIENLYWDNFFYHSEKPEIINYKKRNFFKSFIDKDVQLIFYPLYISFALDNDKNTFSVVIDGIDGGNYIFEIFELENNKKSVFPISSTISLVAGLMFADGMITNLFQCGNGLFEIFAGFFIFLVGFYTIFKGYIKW